MLEVRSLHVRLGARDVLRDASLRVGPGELCVVLGPNGSGKSTLLRTLAGLVAPRGGELRWNDRPLPVDKRERARLVALLPQTFTGAGELTVEEMALLGRTPHLPPYGTPSGHDRDLVNRSIERVAPDLRGRRLGELSGGERQRALLPRVLVTQAPILLLDEPVAALDVRHQGEILGLVRRLTREEGLATLVSLHDLNLAALVADTLVLLDETGAVAASGTADDVLRADVLERVYRLPMRVSVHPTANVPQAQPLWNFNALRPPGNADERLPD